MRALLVLLTLLAGLAATGSAGAQDCAPAGETAAEIRQDWQDELVRLRRQEKLANRDEGRLVLALDGGRSLALVDCAAGAPPRRYLFERYDQPGRFYVVRTLEADDFYYTLVLMPSGKTETVHGSPVWAFEKSRFLTVACSLEPPRGALHIRSPAGDGLSTEAEFPLPCDRESCSARWDHEAWIAVTCTPRETGGKKGSEFVLMRSNNGQWSKLGR